jgi:hypothetical protein
MIKKFTLLLLAMLCIAGTSKADVEWTLWEGSESFDTSGGVTDIGSYCRSIQVGDVLTFTVNFGEYAYHQKTLDVKSSTGDWSTTYLASYENFTDAEISACAYTQEVTAKMYEEIVTNSGMFEVGGKGYTLTKVTAKRSLATCIKTTLAKLTANGNFDGSKLNNAVAGDYLYVEATVSTGNTYGEYTLSGNGVSTLTYKVYDKLLLTLTDAQLTAWTSNNCWPWSTLTNLSAANIYLIHPVSSFSIGSIGYATFSANQEVTAPASVTAYQGKIDGDELVLTKFTNNVIPAEQGAIIVGDEGAVLEFTASSTGSTESSELIANTSATDVTTLESGYDYYVLNSGTDESETELALSTLLANFGNWHGESTAISWNSSTYTLTYNEAYGSSEGGWCGSDWSGYDKLKLNFSANTLNNSATFYVAYNGASDSETTSASLDPGAKTVTISLNPTYKSSIGNISLFSSATSGSLTFESAALIDSDGATVPEFRKLKTTSGTLAANKAYLKIPQGVGTRAFSVVFSGGTTAIDKVTTEQNTYPEGIFNLYGQRVNQPGKGIYIVNGKKMIFK